MKMSEEIKKIIEDVKRHLDYVEATKQASIRDNEMKAMYYYITNLQEENQKLVKVIEDLEEWLVKIINDDRTNNSVTGTLLYILNKLTELKGGKNEDI